MKDVAKISNVSVTTVASLLPYLSTSASYMQKVLHIDDLEKKQVTTNIKYL